MSPFAKEQVYRLYLKGTTIKDLSLKFGIIPQRVKAIVYQKHLYWEEVYPRLGELHMKMAIETEALYAAEFPFVDYGADLQIMSGLEAGIKIEKFHRTAEDTQMAPEEVKRVEEYIAKHTKARRWTRIPETFHGKGGGGWLLYDWVHHRRSGAAKPVHKMQNLIRWQNTNREHYSPNMLAKRMQMGGARWAM